MILKDPRAAMDTGEEKAANIQGSFLGNELKLYSCITETETAACWQTESAFSTSQKHSAIFTAVKLNFLEKFRKITNVKEKNAMW